MRKHNHSTEKTAMSLNTMPLSASRGNKFQSDHAPTSHLHFAHRKNQSSSGEPSRLRPNLIRSQSAEVIQKNTSSGPHSPPNDLPRLSSRSKAANRGPHSPPNENDPIAKQYLHQERMNRTSQSHHTSRIAVQSPRPAGDSAVFNFLPPNQPRTHVTSHPNRLAKLNTNEKPMLPSPHPNSHQRYTTSSPAHYVRPSFNSNCIGRESHIGSANPCNVAHISHAPHVVSNPLSISNPVIPAQRSHEQSMNPTLNSIPAEASHYNMTPSSEPERLGVSRSPDGIGHSGNTTPVMQYISAPKVQSIPKHPPTPKPAVDTTHFVMVTYTNLSIAPRLPIVSHDLHQQPLHAAALALHAMASFPRFPRLPPPTRITETAVRQHHDPRASVAHLVHPKDSIPDLGPPDGEVLPILSPVPTSPVQQHSAPVSTTGAQETSGTALREFQCHFAGCTKSFDRRYNLKVHYRRHTNETPYPCKVTSCPQKFKWRSSLAHHMRTRHKGVVITRPSSSSSPNGRGEGSSPSIVASSSHASSHSGTSEPNSPLSDPVRPAKMRRVAISPFAADKPAVVKQESQGNVGDSGHPPFRGGVATTVSDQDHVSTPESERQQKENTAESLLTEESPQGISSKRSHDQMRDEAHGESR